MLVREMVLMSGLKKAWMWEMIWDSWKVKKTGRLLAAQDKKTQSQIIFKSIRCWARWKAG